MQSLGAVSRTNGAFANWGRFAEQTERLQIGGGWRNRRDFCKAGAVSGTGGAFANRGRLAGQTGRLQIGGG